MVAKGKEAVNPFVINTAVVRLKAIQCFTTKEYVTPDDLRLDDDGVITPMYGEGFQEANLTNSFLSDQTPNCRLYQTKSVLDLIKLLDGNGRTMILFIQYRLKKDADIIEITFEDYSDFAGVSSNKTFYNAISQMLDNGVLQKHKTHKYWVNPFFIFNGNRLAKYPDNVDIVAKVKLLNGFKK